MSRTIWAMPVTQPDGSAWRCPRCGEPSVYGSRRSLWSLLPGVCSHAIVDWSSRVRQGTDAGIGLAYISVDGPVVPIAEGLYESTRWMKFKARLRQRLSDELKGLRNHWWGPLTREAWIDLHRFPASPSGLS